MSSLSIYSFSYTHKNLKLYNSNNSNNKIPIFTHKFLKPISLKPLCNNPLSTSSNDSNYSQFQNVEKLQKIQNFQKPMSKISFFFTQNIVTVLLGSFVFMGCFCSKPVLAASVEKVEKLEDETMYAKSVKKGEKLGSQENETMYKKSVEKGEKLGSQEKESMYEMLLEINPKDVEVLKSVFHEKMAKGKTKEAVVYVEKLIDIEPNEVEWRLLQALCYEMMGKFSQAKRLFKDILAKRPLLTRALHGLAMAMHKNREGPAVFEMLNTALELARQEKRVTEERNIRILIAQMHVVKGDLEEALKHFQALVDENPRDFRPYLCQGIIYSLMDKKNEAEEQFGIYRSLVPDEFPQRGFLDDVVLAAKTSSHEQLEKEFQAEYSYKSS